MSDGADYGPAQRSDAPRMLRFINSEGMILASITYADDLGVTTPIPLDARLVSVLPGGES